jgi:hypothetical protein
MLLEMVKSSEFRGNSIRNSINQIMVGSVEKKSTICIREVIIAKKMS